LTISKILSDETKLIRNKVLNPHQECKGHLLPLDMSGN